VGGWCCIILSAEETLTLAVYGPDFSIAEIVQESVDHLSHAMEAGKEGMEEAIKETGVVYRQSAAQREQEVLLALAPH